MKNFLRVVQLTLRRRYTFAAAIACSLGVAFFWGGNLAVLQPVIDIFVSGDKQPQEVVDIKLAEAKAHLATTESELAKIDAEIVGVAAQEKRPLEAQRERLAQRRTAEQKIVEWVEYLRPLAKRYLPNDTFTAIALF